MIKTFEGSIFLIHVYAFYTDRKRMFDTINLFYIFENGTVFGYPLIVDQGAYLSFFFVRNLVVLLI
jgi:hypothetical protein